MLSSGGWDEKSVKVYVNTSGDGGPGQLLHCSGVKDEHEGRNVWIWRNDRRQDHTCRAKWKRSEPQKESRSCGLTGHYSLTVVFLHGSWRGNEHRLRRVAVLLMPLNVFPGDDVKLGDLLGRRVGTGVVVWLSTPTKHPPDLLQFRHSCWFPALVVFSENRSCGST